MILNLVLALLGFSLGAVSLWSYFHWAGLIRNEQEWRKAMKRDNE